MEDGKENRAPPGPRISAALVRERFVFNLKNYRTGGLTLRADSSQYSYELALPDRSPKHCAE